MHDLVPIFLSLLLGLTSGFISSLSAGGALISISGLIFLGLPPSTAIATSRLDSMAADLSSLVRLEKAGLIKWHYATVFIIIGIFGSFMGSKLLLEIDEHMLEKAVGAALVLLIPIIALNKNFGKKYRRRSEKRHVAGFASIFLISVYVGVFGGAAGIFLIYALIYFFGMSFMQANTNRKLWGTFAILTSLIIFILAGIVDFKFGIPLAIGSATGAYIGTSTALKEGNDFVRIIFLVIVTLSAVVLIS